MYVHAGPWAWRVNGNSYHTGLSCRHWGLWTQVLTIRPLTSRTAKSMRQKLYALWAKLIGFFQTRRNWFLTFIKFNFLLTPKVISKPTWGSLLTSVRCYVSFLQETGRPGRARLPHGSAELQKVCKALLSTHNFLLCDDDYVTVTEL